MVNFHLTISLFSRLSISRNCILPIRHTTKFSFSRIFRRPNFNFPELLSCRMSIFPKSLVTEFLSNRDSFFLEFPILNHWIGCFNATFASFLLMNSLSICSVYAHIHLEIARRVVKLIVKLSCYFWFPSSTLNFRLHFWKFNLMIKAHPSGYDSIHPIFFHVSWGNLNSFVLIENDFWEYCRGTLNPIRRVFQLKIGSIFFSGQVLKQLTLPENFWVGLID